MLTKEEKLELKAQIDKMRGELAPVSDEEREAYPGSVQEAEIPVPQGHAKVYIIEKGVPGSRPLIINFHGGGFIGRHMDRDELFCRKAANRFEALVVDVDYKLAPEHPFPYAINECQAVVEYLIMHSAEYSFDPKKVILTGHSSGGNLAAGVCMKNQENRYFTPLCAVLDYPPLDLYKDPFEKPQSICDMPAERARMYNEKYITPDDAKNPYASPVFASPDMLSAFPPTLIITAGEDRLCEEGEEFALHLMRAGISVTAKRFQRSIHGFVINRMCEHEEAENMIFNFIDSHIRTAMES